MRVESVNGVGVFCLCLERDLVDSARAFLDSQGIDYVLGAARQVSFTQFSFAMEKERNLLRTWRKQR